MSMPVASSSEPFLAVKFAVPSSFSAVVLSSATF